MEISKSVYIKLISFISILSIGSYSCKVGKISHEEDCNISSQNYSIDTLKSLNSYIELFSDRKLSKEHYCFTVISNINIVDVRNEKIIPNQYVILHHNQIFKIWDSKDSIPKFPKEQCVLEIDGSTKYLAPGLCDMHVHYQCGARSRLDYLVTGVTTIRNVGSDKVHTDEQLLLAESKIIGPNLYMTSNQREKSGRTDSLFLDSISCYANWIYFSDFNSSNNPSNYLLVNETGMSLSLDNERPDSDFEYPEGTVIEQWSGVFHLAKQKNFESFWFMSKLVVENYKNGSHASDDEYRRIISEELKQLLKTNTNQFCIGTESGIIGSNISQQSIISLHRELKSLSQLGISNKNIIKMATLNAGLMCKQSNKIKEERNINCFSQLNFGEVKEGYSADLLILNKNPFEAIEYYTDFNCMFIKGTFLSEMDMIELKEILKMGLP